MTQQNSFGSFAATLVDISVAPGLVECDTLPAPPSTQALIVFDRTLGDHDAGDHWVSFQPIIATDSNGHNVLAWLRRYGGPKTSLLSDFTARDAGKTINPAASAL